MGQIMSNTEEIDLSNIPEGNGYFLNDTLIPDEVFIHIFSYLPDKCLVTVIPYVCKHWNKLCGDFCLWVLRLRRNGIKLSNDRLDHLRQNWADEKIQHTLKYLSLNSHLKGFNHNLIKNPVAAEGRLHWNSVKRGRNNIVIESPPVGCKPIPEEAKATRCWVTSYEMSTRCQKIILKDFGVHPFMLDILKPKIIQSEWACGRFDCSSIVQLKMDLYGVGWLQKCNNHNIDEDRNTWRKLDLIVPSDECPEGLYNIMYRSMGKDTQFWAGFYGSKTTSSSLILDIESES